MPDFSTYFETVWDPGEPSRNWIVQKEFNGVKYSEVKCLDYIREVIELTFGAVTGASETDVEKVAIDAFDYAVACSFFQFSHSRLAIWLCWQPIMDPQSWAQHHRPNRPIIITQPVVTQQASFGFFGTNPVPVPGAVPEGEMVDIDTSKIDSPPVDPPWQPQRVSAPPPAPPQEQSLNGRCYLCSRVGYFVMEDKSDPKICDNCVYHHLIDPGSC